MGNKWEKTALGWMIDDPDDPEIKIVKAKDGKMYMINEGLLKRQMQPYSDFVKHAQKISKIIREGHAI